MLTDSSPTGRICCQRFHIDQRTVKQDIAVSAVGNDMQCIIFHTAFVKIFIDLIKHIAVTVKNQHISTFSQTVNNNLGVLDIITDNNELVTAALCQSCRKISGGIISNFTLFGFRLNNSFGIIFSICFNFNAVKTFKSFTDDIIGTCFKKFIFSSFSHALISGDSLHSGRDFRTGGNSFFCFRLSRWRRVRSLLRSSSCFFSLLFSLLLSLLLSLNSGLFSKLFLKLLLLLLQILIQLFLILGLNGSGRSSGIKKHTLFQTHD